MTLGRLAIGTLLLNLTVSAAVITQPFSIFSDYTIWAEYPTGFTKPNKLKSVEIIAQVTFMWYAFVESPYYNPNGEDWDDDGILDVEPDPVPTTDLSTSYDLGFTIGSHHEFLRSSEFHEWAEGSSTFFFMDQYIRRFNLTQNLDQFRQPQLDLRLDEYLNLVTDSDGWYGGIAGTDSKILGIISYTYVPEPTTLLLTAITLGMLLVAQRHKRTWQI